MSTRIKICGITRSEDAIAAARLDSDAIGLVFVPGSPRCIEVARAGKISAAVPTGVSIVGLFLDPSRTEVETVLKAVPLALLQFHGRESAEFCAGFDVPYIKTIGVENRHEAEALISQYDSAYGLLFDSHRHGAAGGTGKRSDWNNLPKAGGKRVLLAGGLDPGNVADAICAARPFAVDVSSGVESKPGIKSHEKLEKFINEVRRADAINP